MSRLSLRLLRDQQGLAALELALIAPVIAGLILVSFEVWRASGRIEDVRGGLKAGAQYYMNGGADDAVARSLALSAWEDAPANAEVAISRSCACGEVANACNVLCPTGQAPSALVTLQATGSYPQALFGSNVSEQRVVRVR